jgi:hypothetical protein
MKKSYVFSLVIAFLILLPFGAVSHANAGKPVRNEIPFEMSLEVENPCGYPITAHFQGMIIETFFFSDNDLKNRVTDVYPSWQAIWSANGKELNIHSGGPVHYKQIPNGHFQIVLGVDGSVMVPGIDYPIYGAGGLITIPGYGTVWGSAGQVILKFQWNEELGTYELAEVVKMVGLPDQTDWAPICEYLGE